MSNTAPSKNQRLQHLGAISLFAMALCYLCLFIIYGAVLPAPGGESIGDKIAHLITHKALVTSTYIIGYILFACCLCISVQALHAFNHGSAGILINTASLFGLFWVLVLLCTGMIGITSLELISALPDSAQSDAAILYRTTVLLVESLGGGIEFIGGVWVLLLGIAGWLNKLFSKVFAVFSMVKGVVGIATLFSAESVLRDLFGLTGIVWFIWLGIIVWQSAGKAATASVPTQTQ